MFVLEEGSQQRLSCFVLVLYRTVHLYRGLYTGLLDSSNCLWKGKVSERVRACVRACVNECESGFCTWCERLENFMGMGDCF